MRSSEGHRSDQASVDPVIESFKKKPPLRLWVGSLNVSSFLLGGIHNMHTSMITFDIF